MLAIEISDDISVKSLTTVKLKLAKKKKKKRWPNYLQASQIKQNHPPSQSLSHVILVFFLSFK